MTPDDLHKIADTPEAPGDCTRPGLQCQHRRSKCAPGGSVNERFTVPHLAAVAAELNGRPRKTLDWETPAERLHKPLAA